ncbi:MAG: maleylpyruvate isomerase family mycothiol-dependent enzyme, partial [Actinomycetes bacterium]
LQRTELDRTVALLETLDASDWAAQTDCPDWDVHHMYLHVLGACEAALSVKELAHQMLAARKYQKANGGPLEAGLSATQVSDRADLTPQQLVDRLRTVAPQTVSKRSSLPGFLRNGVRTKVDGPVVEQWKLGYLIDTIYLRDLWLHRIDAHRAIGRTPTLDAAHDGRIVADVVAEWARRHGKPFRLELSGEAGGSFTSGTNGEHLSMDAVEFCRTLGGREAGAGLLSTIVPF